MKKLLPIVFVSIFVSISSFAAKGGCKKIVGKLSRIAQLDILSTNALYSDDGLKRLRSYGRSLKLSEEVIDEFSKSALNHIEKKEMPLLENFLDFIANRREMNRMKAAKEFAFYDNGTSDNFVKKFKKIQKKINHRKDKLTKRFEKKILKENPDLSGRRLAKRVEKEVNLQLRPYRKLSFECRSKIPNTTRAQATASFKKFTVGIGLASSFVAMGYQNRDEDMSDWIGRFGYESVLGTIGGLIGAKIISNPATTNVVKGIQKYFFARTWGVIDMTAFGFIFGASQDEARARLDQLMKDPNNKVELKRLVAVLEEKNFYKTFKETILSKAYVMIGKEGMSFDSPIEVEGVDFSNLQQSDLENEEVQAILLSAVLADMYQENAGGLIQSGNVGIDRYAFHAVYGLALLPKDVFMSLTIYNTLCLGLNNPKVAILKALGIYTVNKVIFDQLYYFVRKFSINQ